MTNNTRIRSALAAARGYADGGAPDEDVNDFRPLTRDQREFIGRTEGTGIHESLSPIDFLGAPGMPWRMAIGAATRYAERRAARAAEDEAARLAAVGRDRPLYESSGSKSFDAIKNKLASGADEERSALANQLRVFGGPKNLRDEFEKSLDPWHWLVYKSGWLGHAGLQTAMNTAMGAVRNEVDKDHQAPLGEVALDSGIGALAGRSVSRLAGPAVGALLGAAVPYISRGTTSPPSSSSSQSHAVQQTGRPDSDFRYPPEFPRLERTESQMRQMYDDLSDWTRSNRYGVLGGGPYSYGDFLKSARTYGKTLHYPPSMNGMFIRDQNYPIGPEHHNYGSGPYYERKDD